MSSLQPEALSSQAAIPSSNPSSSSVHVPSDSAPPRGASGGRGQRRGRWRGKGRGGQSISIEAEEKGGVEKPQTSDKPKPPPRPRPTHFLSLPLNDHADLRNRVSAFQNALLGDDNTAQQSTTGVEPNPTAPSPSTNTNTNKRKRKTPARVSTVVEGLDASIVIDPRRLHMTLGVMALEPEISPSESTTGVVDVPDSSSSTKPLDFKGEGVAATDSLPCEGPSKEGQSVTQPIEQAPITEPIAMDTPSPPRKTIASALELLTSLKPSISDILSGSTGVEIPLETLDAFGTERMRRPNTNTNKPGAVSCPITTTTSHVDETNLAAAAPERSSSSNPSNGKEEGADTDADADVGAGVLFLGPREGQRRNDDDDERYNKLKRVCDLIYQTFKKEGYLTDTRPLKLHCTILNTNYRKPKRRLPFSYTDILASPACQLLGADPPTPRVSQSQGELLKRTDDDRVIDASAPEAEAEAKVGSMGMDSTIAQAGTPATEEKKPRPKPKPKPKYRPPLKVPPPLPISLGTYHVREVQLWEMGSRGPFFF